MAGYVTFRMGLTGNQWAEQLLWYLIKHSLWFHHIFLHFDTTLFLGALNEEYFSLSAYNLFIFMQWIFSECCSLERNDKFLLMLNVEHLSRILLQK